jgi:peroxiredoxin
MSLDSGTPGESAGARHLKRGRRMPDLALPTTAGRSVNFAELSGRAVVFCYPWTGRPGQPNPPSCRNLHIGFRDLGIQVFGLSTQPSEYQRELVERLALPYEIVSDEDFALQKKLALPTFATGGVRYLKRLTLGLKDGRIDRVYYPVDAPASHAREVCAWLGMIHRTL